jgi:multidrug resistance efflux pump
MTIILFVAAVPMFSQGPPASPDRPWHSSEQGQMARDSHRSAQCGFPIDRGKIYSLAELVDLAEAHNPQTRAAWENARAQAEALGIARSELHPTLSAVAFSSVNRVEAGSEIRFYRQTMFDSQVTLELGYAIFDFGAHRGRIDAAAAHLLATYLRTDDSEIQTALAQQERSKAMVQSSQAQHEQEQISEGANAHIGRQIFTLIDSRTWWALDNFREGQLQHIAPGMPADVYAMSQPNVRFSGVLDGIGFGVTPNGDAIGRLTPDLPDVQRTLNWVHLASRYPVRVRVENPPPELFRVSKSVVVVIRGH